MQKKNFKDFLKATQIRPEDIGYDPEYKTNLDVEREGDAYSFNVGWTACSSLFGDGRI